MFTIVSNYEYLNFFKTCIIRSNLLHSQIIQQEVRIYALFPCWVHNTHTLFSEYELPLA